MRVRSRAATLAVLACACSDSAGSDGSKIAAPFDQLAGGIVFATSRIAGSAGYDLYWIPFPDIRTTGALPFLRLTEAPEDEWQPSVARNGRGIAYVSDFSIFFINDKGEVRRISDTRDTPYRDSLPAVSHNADRIAWVREDTSRKVVEGFDLGETYIVMAEADGTNEKKVAPREGVIQDAPAFEPKKNATRLAWAEWNAKTRDPTRGPKDYGVFIQDFIAGTGGYACQSHPNGFVTPGTEALPPGNKAYRCFGQHMVWPELPTIVLGQDMLEISVGTSQLATVWHKVTHSIQAQSTGFPNLSPRVDGFFPAFPLSINYDNPPGRMVFDGIIESIDGDLTELAMFTADASGDGVHRIEVAGWSADLDTFNTNTFLYSVATPQVLPFPAE